MTILFLYIYIVMFHKANSEAETQQVFDAYICQVSSKREK
jgi:hypothetical protein